MTVNIGVAVKITLPLLVAAFAIPAFGTEVDFTTTGVFSCGSIAGPAHGAITATNYATDPGCQLSNGGSKITIANNDNELVLSVAGFTNNNVFPADININPVTGYAYDDVNVAVFSVAATNNPGTPAHPQAVNTGGATFTLDINQSSPPGFPNTGSLGGSFSGSILARGSSVQISFLPGEQSLTLHGNIIYTLDFFPTAGVWNIPNPGNGHLFPVLAGGVATETATVTPEPTFMMLTGLGFAGLAFVAYRRKRTV